MLDWHLEDEHSTHFAVATSRLRRLQDDMQVQPIDNGWTKETSKRVADQHRLAINDEAGHLIFSPKIGWREDHDSVVVCIFRVSARHINGPHSCAYLRHAPAVTDGYHKLPRWGRRKPDDERPSRFHMSR